jgi:hypothetical protein
MDELIEKVLREKVISGVTLQQALQDEPETFERIKDLCILADTALDGEQAEDALEELSRYTPNRQPAYVISFPKDGFNIIAWTYLTAKTWQFVVEMPEYFRTLRKYGELLYFPVN